MTAFLPGCVKVPPVLASKISKITARKPKDIILVAKSTLVVHRFTSCATAILHIHCMILNKLVRTDKYVTAYGIEDSEQSQT